jgi:hypothetical protein
MGTEASRFHPRRMFLPAGCQQLVEDGFSQFRGSRSGKTGAHAAAGIRSQGELADQQQAATGVGDAEVHPALPVVEDAIAEQAFGHARNLRCAIARLDADQGKQAGADRTDGVAVDGDAGLGDALDEGEHSVGKPGRDWSDSALLVILAKAGSRRSVFISDRAQ